MGPTQEKSLPPTAIPNIVPKFVETPQREIFNDAILENYT